MHTFSEYTSLTSCTCRMYPAFMSCICIVLFHDSRVLPIRIQMFLDPVGIKIINVAIIKLHMISLFEGVLDTEKKGVLDIYSLQNALHNKCHFVIN